MISCFGCRFCRAFDPEDLEKGNRQHGIKYANNKDTIEKR